MKNSNNSDTFNYITNTLNNSTLKRDKIVSQIFGFSDNSSSKSTIDNMSNKEDESSNKEYNESDDFNVDTRDDYNEKQDTSLDSQGVIDSIANELTSVRLQQAIILSEIVGKPRSKTRRKRRF